MSTEAMKLALEALEDISALQNHSDSVDSSDVDKAITALREALANQPAQYRSTGWAAHRDQYAVPVLFNPYTGEPRDVRDVQSDPQGILIMPPGKVEMRTAKQTHHTEQHLEMVQPAPAQPQQEPDNSNYRLDPPGLDSLYTSPPARKPLTDEQKLMCWSRATHDADVEHKTENQCLMDYGSEIEAAHGIKEQP